LEQILTNLLANAIKYAPGAPIAVTVKQEQNIAVLEVRDQGPGLRDEDLPRIFGRFERASSQAEAGMGLGLYIARQVAETHGGTVTARNLDHDGACFTVRLPLRPLQAPKDAASPAV
jgi:signal transduction histidine kinase